MPALVAFRRACRWATAGPIFPPIGAGLIHQVNMTWQGIGLIVFALVVGLNAAGLGLDAALFSQGLPTVSDFARRNQWSAALIILLNAVGLFGLAVHFSNGKGD